MQKSFIIIFLSAAVLSSCPDNDQYCAACQDKECKMCYSAFLNFGNCVTPTTKVENCLRYSKDGVCDVCYHGYAVGNNGLCAKIGIKDCLYVENDKCKMCVRKILVKDGKCEGEKCQSPYCAFCTRNEKNEEICDQCITGYTLLMGEKPNCVKENDNTQHCVMAKDENTCSLCEVNYYHKNGKCVKSDVMKIEMISDQSFFDKAKEKITNLFGSTFNLTIISLFSTILLVFA